MHHPTEQLATFISGLDVRQLPASVGDKIRECLIDFIGVCCIAYRADSTPAFFAGGEKLSGAGDCTVVGSAKTYPFQYAAMLNGILAHTSDFDDTNAIGGGHIGAPVIPAALAAAERWSCSGADFLAGLVAGYETMVRVGTALGTSAYERGFHPTAVDGVFGATAAVCRIAHADAATTANALGLALSTAAGSMQYLENGAWNKRWHPGLAAYHGIVCHALASAGVLGAAQPLEGKFGLLRGYSDKPDRSWLARDLGSDWYTLKTAIKPYPSCRFTHGAIDAVRALRAEGMTDPDAIEQIDVTISPVAYEIVGDSRPNKVMPNNVVDAQFSMYFQIAAALIDGNVFWDSYRLLGEPAVGRIAKRIRIGVEPGFAKIQTRLQVRTGGASKTREVLYPIGDERNPLSAQDVMDKFRSNAEGRFAPAQARCIAESVEHALGTEPDMQRWIRQTLRGDRP